MKSPSCFNGGAGTPASFDNLFPPPEEERALSF
jgi:hypothetical protein